MRIMEKKMEATIMGYITHAQDLNIPDLAPNNFQPEWNDTAYNTAYSPAALEVIAHMPAPEAARIWSKTQNENTTCQMAT